MAALKTGDPNLDQSNVSLNETIESSVNTDSLMSNLDMKRTRVVEGSPGHATTNSTKVEKNNPPVVPLVEGSSLKGNVQQQSSNPVQTPHSITASPSQLSNLMGQMLAAFGGMGGAQGGIHATNPLFQASQLLPPIHNYKINGIQCSRRPIFLKATFPGTSHPHQGYHQGEHHSLLV